MRCSRFLVVLPIATVTVLVLPTSADAALVGHWKFDEGSGTTAADSSGNGYDADQTIASGSWTTGKAGGAYDRPRFSLDAAESDILNLAGGSAVTLSAWVTTRTGTNFEGIAGFEGTGFTGDIYSLKMDNADKIVWTVNTAQVVSTNTLTNYAGATGDGWVHLVGVFDEGNSTLYVNGSPDNSGTAASPIVDKTPPGTFNIGRYFNSSSYVFTGSIDDVQVYDQALSADDVTFLLNNPGTALGAGSVDPVGAVVSVSIGNTSQSPPTTTTPVFDPTDVAGVIARANWNEFDGSNPAATPGTLVNDAGDAVPGLGFIAVGNQNTYNYGGSTGDLKLMSSFLSETQSLEITGIPYASYDLYLYTDPFGDGNFTDFALDGNVQTATDTGIYIATQSFTEGDNYLLFSGLSGSDLLVTLNNTVPGALHFQGLQGFQIVERISAVVPEPGTFALAALGLLGLGWCGPRRRRQAA